MKLRNIVLIIGVVVGLAVVLVLVPDWHGPAPRSPYEIHHLQTEDLFGGSALRLVQAAERGHTRAIDDLVKSGVDVNHRGRYDVTPLHRVLVAQNKDGYSALLKHGADPNVRHARGLAVMHQATMDPDPFWVEEALKHGGDPNMLDTGNPFTQGETPLFYTTNSDWRNRAKGRRGQALALVRAGADVNAKDGNGNSVLKRAYQGHHYDVTYTLLEAGADFKVEGSENLAEWIVGRKDLITGMYPEQWPWAEKCLELLKTKGVEVRRTEH